MHQCKRCRKSTEIHGDGNLGELLTPSLQGKITLCPTCWELCVRESNGLADWESLMQRIVQCP